MKLLNYLQILIKYILGLALALTLIFPSSAFAQENNGSGSVGPALFMDLTRPYGYPTASIEWSPDPEAAEPILFMSYESPVTFTGLSLGWQVETGDYEASDFTIQIRTGESPEHYGKWHTIAGEYTPMENPSGLYWSELYLTPAHEIHTSFEIQLIPPAEAGVNLLRVSLADVSCPDEDEASLHSSYELFQTSSHTLLPQIIERMDWWGSLPLEHLDSPEWLPEAISITHGIIHHPVTENNPSNPAQAVRSIWHYHAVSLGWGDIGYNFLIDQHGNIYQGRYNPWLYITDTRAGHAGFSNLKSVGISLLGQFHPSLSSPAPDVPTDAAIASLEKLLAWRFYQRDLDAQSIAGIETKHYGFIDVQRVCGHRDVSRTSCPGDSLYAYMPSIRANVHTLVEDYAGDQNIMRLAGSNRYQTAVEISQNGWPMGAETVFLTRVDEYADALAGVPLAYQLDAPILLTPNHQLADITAHEIQRLQADQVIILGGFNAISSAVEYSLQQMGLEVKRIAGETRYATAAHIAREMINLGQVFDTAFITVSTNFADALSASAYAAQRGYPIFMTTTDDLPEETTAALQELGITNTFVVGGTGVVSEDVFNKLPNPRRISGDNRYATSMALAEEFLSPDQISIFMATGLDFPDAITGSVLAAKNHTGILLVQGNEIQPNPIICDYLIQKGIQIVTLLGGNSVITTHVESWLRSYL